jgi:K(+)-stimulated pyrophosphate-energized sodium pump
LLEVSAPLVTSIFALLFVCYLVYFVLSRSQGTERMAEISRAVQIGAKAFLKREY